MHPTQIRAIFMKKFTYLFALIAISLCFVQCEKNKIEQNGMHEGYEYVDLGLSVKWATYNVGATTPEGFGDYFAWGEVEPKDYYFWDTYKYCNGAEATYTKYCHDKDYGFNGFVDNKFELDPEDDVASVNWGGKWRMPTLDEFDDLRYSCTWEWTTQNGVTGLLGTSRVVGYTDRTIFFPAAGMILEDYTTAQEEFPNGWYWSKSVGENYNPTYATHIFYFQKNPEQLKFSYIFPRIAGATVRAVCP